jgi:hypothetical protein
MRAASASPILLREIAGGLELGLDGHGYGRAPTNAGDPSGSKSFHWFKAMFPCARSEERHNLIVLESSCL